MIKALANWKGKVSVNGVEYQSIADIPDIKLDNTVVISLIPNVTRQTAKRVDDTTEHIITVKKYMTQPASPTFDFMKKWNSNVPMPMRTMQGVILKETKGMVQMRLHGFAKKTITCVMCGRDLTNPISRAYGIGPICLGKLGISRDIDDVSGITEDLVNMEWTGWIIKSAITSDEIAEEV